MRVEAIVCPGRIYLKHEMVSPERRRLRNIVVDSERMALSIVERAARGADFARLAAEYSLDQSTNDKGGELGALTADQLDKEFATAAFRSKDGATFGPNESYRVALGQTRAR